MQKNEIFPHKQPNSRMCFLCGLENPVGLKLAFFQKTPDEVEAEFTAPAHFQGYPGFLHGGITAALLDEVSGRAIIGGEPTRFMVTMKMEIRYRKPIPVETPLRIIGRIVRDRGRMAETQGKILLPDGSTGAEATVWIAEAPGGFVSAGEEELLGWKVYD